MILPFSLLMAGPFIMTKEGSLIKANDLNTTNTSATTTWTPIQLPTQAYNVLDYGLKGDGVTDDSAALRALAQNTGVTNWYFPQNKTFLLSRIDIPSHIVAVFGGGKIISKGYTGDANPEGAFTINNVGQNAHENLIIDGLSFGLGSGFDGGEAYGQITVFQYGGSTNGIEIRNCRFDQAGHKMVAIKAFAESDGSMSHNGLRIYNNNVVNIQGISFELFNKENADNSMGFTNTHLYSNTFSSGGGMAISMAGIRQPFYIHHNTFTNINWAIETAECDKGEIYNNYGTGLRTYSFTDSIKWNGPFVSPGSIKIHHNHFEGTGSGKSGTFLLYNGGPTEVYENYIKGATFVKIDNFNGKDTNTIMGDIHDNTFVLDFAHEWSNHTVAISQVSEGTFRNNEVYNTLSGKYGVTSSTSGQTYSGNNIYVNGGICINGDTQTGGSCNTSYGGTPPTSRYGAGL